MNDIVEVVIRIPKDTFDAAGILQEYVGDTRLTSGYQIGKNSTFGTMIKAIANGTVLPKGHGDLKDANYMKREGIINRGNYNRSLDRKSVV